MSIHDRIAKDIATYPVVLYMKGSKDTPLCGFSAKVVQILNLYLDDYETRNVLEDEELRQGIKAFSDWPTIPQLYIHGEFVGGCDIVSELHQTQELEKFLKQI